MSMYDANIKTVYYVKFPDFKLIKKLDFDFRWGGGGGQSKNAICANWINWMVNISRILIRIIINKYYHPWFIQKSMLTLYCLKYSDLPLFHGTPPLRKPLPHLNFKIMFTPYIHTLNITIFELQKLKTLYGFKIAAKNEFSLRENCHMTKIWKKKTLSQRKLLTKFSSKLQNINTFTCLK